jgi:FkbM family methyltransferase
MIGTTLAREHAAHLVALFAGVLSPWWRFRLWARLAGPTAYRTIDDDRLRDRHIWPHDYEMKLRASDWMERYALLSGRYYQDDLIEVIQQSLKPGDTYVDIGANLGFTMLTAARAVGPTGRIVAFEPNATLVQRLEDSLRSNQIEHITIHNAALGESEGFVQLVDTGHHGTGYIDPTTASTGSVRRVRGDELLGGFTGRVFVKIDVEGAELTFLGGLPELLARQGDTAFLVEICEHQLNRFGASAKDVFEVFAKNGYKAWLPRLTPFSSRVRLKPMPGPTGRLVYDAMFTRGAPPLAV